MRIKIDGKCAFADYFPHLPLGDRSVEEFLSSFKDQSHDYDRRVLDLLLKDFKFQNQASVSFANHQLWTGSEPLEGRVIKYKLLSSTDNAFLDPLKRGLRLRLDGNGIFRRETYLNFLASIPQQYHEQIEYIEDPLHESNWSDLPLASAQDFIQGSPFQYYIYKPNCEFAPKEGPKVIFSGYLGSDLGAWHTYCVMMEEADLSLTHGIIGSGFYVEERGLFKGHYREGMRPDLNVVRNVYQELQLRSWKMLCHI